MDNFKRNRTERYGWSLNDLGRHVSRRRARTCATVKKLGNGEARARLHAELREERLGHEFCSNEERFLIEQFELDLVSESLLDEFEEQYESYLGL